jgi:hypothetical protein
MRRRRGARRTGSTRSGRTTTRSPNLVTDFLNTGPPDFVEHSDYVAVECHTFSAD